MHKNKISIIIPTYNVEKYISGCLDSIIIQNYSNYEVICVDDCSEDKTRFILQDYSKKNSKIKVIGLTKHSSANIARKKGVELAKGDYILFVDGDDTLVNSALDVLVDEMELDPVDILHFGTSIINCDHMPDNRIKSMEKFTKPLFERLEGKNVFTRCFLNKDYHFSLWNKMYRAQIVKKAFSEVEELELLKAQDKYEYFLIAYYASSYRGIKDVLYNYNFGNGLTGHNTLKAEQFSVYATMGKTARAMLRFSEKADEDVRRAAVSSCLDLASDGITNMLRLSEEDYSWGMDALIEEFGIPYIVAAFANKYFWNRQKCVDIVGKSEKLFSKPKAIKTIGTYYHRLESGGVQRVLASLADIWTNLGYEVVVFTDTKPTENDYPLPDGVKQVVLPAASDCNKDNYLIRALELDRLLKEYSVDIMVYHAWVNSVILWDELVCKWNDVKFAIHCHSVFSMLQINRLELFAELPYVYSLADGIITLSDADKEYWSNFNDYVISVVNPTAKIENAVEDQFSYNSKNIIWCQRISPEKRPEDMIEIFKIVHEIIPSAKLFMLGKADNDLYFEKIKDLVKKYGLQQDVLFFGYQKDVDMFYRMSAVSVITSEYEGFPLGMIESMKNKVPVVMYNMPYLTLVERSKGIITIDDRDKTSMAMSIVQLLNDCEMRKEYSIQAYESIKEILSFDYSTVWRDFFEHISTHQFSPKKIDVMWKTLFQHYKIGVSKVRNEVSLLEKNQIFVEKKTTKESDEREKYREMYFQSQFHLTEIWNSKSYKIGRFLTFIPRLIRHILFKRAM